MTLQTRAGEVDVEVVVHDPTATVADLAAALRPDTRGAGGGLVLDGVHRAGSAGLAECSLRPGCVIGAAPPAAPVHPEPIAEVRLIGGLDAGGRHCLPCGPFRIGRDPACDIVVTARTTSRRHATIVVGPTAVRLVDDASTVGTWVDGQRVDDLDLGRRDAVVALGAVLVRVTEPVRCEPAVLGRPEPDGRVPLRRPPLRAEMASVPPVTPPPNDPAPAGAPHFGWAAACVPLVGGLVLAWFVDPRLAVFTLLGPAVIIGQWFEERRRHRRATVVTQTTDEDRIADFVAAILDAGTAEARRRRSTYPDPAEVGQEIEARGARLWSCRPADAAFASVMIGAAPALPWEPPVSRTVEGPAARVLAEARLPPHCPSLVALRPGHHLGIAGPREACLAVGRWALLQLAGRHGPADLRLGVVCSRGREADWAWAGFLPHVAMPGSRNRRLLAVGADHANQIAQSYAPGASPAVLLVDADDPEVDIFPSGVVPDSWSTVTIASSRRALPARCTMVLELGGPDGWGQLDGGGVPSHAVLATGIGAATAQRWARGLAGLTDPEAAEDGASVPASVRLFDLLGVEEVTHGMIRTRWDRSGPGLAFPIGRAAGSDGAETVILDLVADGPHALVAGTTGAGKSELLRSFVAALAASYPPDRLALLLVDFKGGAAFAEAAHLPHVVGVVTDLGSDEAARALRSLEAELHRRERLLADLGLRELAAHPSHAGGPVPPGLEPLPRVVVVIDELAALVTELPSFLDNLVQLAARGRSLGLHLVLGTQRPGGVVSAAVRTNCALRCCLRMPDEADALDVVGSVAPARIDRRLPGRAFVRRGGGDLVEVQVALVGGRRGAGLPPVTVTPAVFGPDPAAPGIPSSQGESDLTGLVEACRTAAQRAGLAPPKGLWLPPLPADLAGVDLPEAGDGVVLGIVDDPDRQRRLPLAWRPTDGPLLAMGSGPGPATALRAAAYALAARHDASELHIYALDLGARGLEPIAALPQVGAVIVPGEQERLHRLLRRLTAELAHRQSARDLGVVAGRPLVLVLVDGVAALHAALDDSAGLAALDALGRVVADGAALGLAVAVAADRPAAVPAAWSAAAAARLAFRCGDPFDLLALGAERLDQSRWPLGRCLEVTSGLVAQVATGGWPELAADRLNGGQTGAAPVQALPGDVPLAALLASHLPRAGLDGVNLPLGIDGRDLGVATVRLRPGQAFFVCGSPGSGRTTTLESLSHVAEMAGCRIVYAGRDVAQQLATEGSVGRPAVVVVDDAERVADADGVLARLAAGGDPGVHVVAALPADAGRAAFGHWSAELRRSGVGLVLRPRSDLDGDVIGIPVLPRWPMSLIAPGRGVLAVDGEAVPVQVARR